MSTGASELPLTAVLRINAACVLFERAWKAGQRPKIEDVLATAAEEDRPVLLRELIALDIHYRRQAGEEPSPETYRQRWPEAAALWAATLWGEAAGREDLPAGDTAAWPVVPGYEIRAELGHGGMGVVYWAWQSGLNRTVALKMILAGGHAGPQELARFRMEAEAVARLQHPNIVQIHDIGEHDGRPYMALEYVDGGSLAQELTGAPWPAHRAAELAETLARAVHHAHRQGIVHRDLTPGNVLLTKAGQPKITDFGLAKVLVGGGPTLTQSGMILGTPIYMAPEQAAGRAKAIGPATDVYALGAVLYELLTGRPPFKAETPLETLQQVQSQEPVPPSRLQPKLPRDLTTICLKCLQKAPERRYGSAETLAEDLRHFQAGEPIRARPVSRAEKLWRWCRRNPAVASLTTVAVLLLLTVAVGSAVATVWLKGERDSAARSRNSEALARDAAEQAGRERRLELAQALQDRAHAGRMSRRQGQRYASLDALAQVAQLARELKLPPERLTQLRNEAIACMALPDVRLARKWDFPPVGISHVAFDNAYQRYARIDRQGQISLRRVADDVELYRWSAFDPGEFGLTWSRDGRFLTARNGNGHQQKVWHCAGPKAVAALPPLSNVAWGDFSPDSCQLAVVTRDGQLILYDLDSGRQIKRVRGVALSGVAGRVMFHPMKRWLAMTMGGNRIQIFDLETDEKLGEDLLHPAMAYSLTWNPDGRSLATACADLKIYVWDLAARRPPAVLEGCRNAGIRLAFNRAGDLLASSDWDGMLRFWHPRTGKQVFSTPGDMLLANPFSPDDRHIVARIIGPSGQSESGLWEVATFREYRTLVHDPVPPRSDRMPSYYGGSLHPNDRWLALAMSDGVRIWDLVSGRQLAWLAMKQTAGVWFEPSGTLLTNGDSGWWRWPLHADVATGSRLRIGPPDRLPVPGMFMGISGSHDGRVLAVPFFDGGMVLHADRPYQPVRLVPQDDVRSVSVSPDGRWVATGSFSGTGIKVWEAATGKLVKELLAVHNMCNSNFSPDGRWLATWASGDDCRLWAVGSWEPGIHIRNGRVAAFTADGRVMATSVALGVLALIDPATGHEYARLEDPNQDDFGWFTFTADGTQVVTSSCQGLAIHVWDLRLIRRQLAGLGLDWDGPPDWTPPGPPDNQLTPAPPDQVEVQGLDLVTNPEKWKHYQHARTVLTLARNPFDAEAHFLLGRELLGAGKAAEAYQQLTFALTFQPGFGAAHAERAEAAFRLGRWADAVADASVVLRDQPYDADTFSLRGQAYQKLGRHAEAVADFTAALARVPRSAQLRKWRATSAAALGKGAEAAADRDQGKTLSAASQ
jgi:WD40 repeat protein